MKNLNISEQMNKVADAFASSRNVSAQEAVYRLLGLPLYVSNFKTIWIPTGFPHQRVRILKTQALITAMEDDEPDIFVANMLQGMLFLIHSVLQSLSCGMRYFAVENQTTALISPLQVMHTMKSRICLAANCQTQFSFQKILEL